MACRQRSNYGRSAAIRWPQGYPQAFPQCIDDPIFESQVDYGFQIEIRERRFTQVALCHKSGIPTFISVCDDPGPLRRSGVHGFLRSDGPASLFAIALADVDGPNKKGPHTANSGNEQPVCQVDFKFGLQILRDKVQDGVELLPFCNFLTLSWEGCNSG